MTESSSGIEMKLAEFAAFCQTTRDTLYWYDKNSLLKPAHRGENGYRYYDQSQFLQYSLISSLKNMGCSLDEIRQFQHPKPLAEYPPFFDEKLECIDRQIARAWRQKRLIQSLNRSVRESLQCRFDEPQVVFLEEEWLFMSKIPEGSNRISTLDYRSISELDRLAAANDDVIPYPHGTVISRQALDTDDPPFLFHFYVSAAPPADPRSIRRQGRYIQMYQRGDYDDISSAIGIIRDFVKVNHLEVCGDFLVYDLVTNIIAGTDADNITKILVPIN